MTVIEQERALEQTLDEELRAPASSLETPEPGASPTLVEELRAPASSLETPESHSSPSTGTNEPTEEVEPPPF